MRILFMLALCVSAAAARADAPHLLPSLSGTTGLVDVPVAFTTPERTVIVSAQLDRVRADASWWEPYLAIAQAHRYFAVTWGAWKDVEVGATVESWDKEVTYANPVTTVTPQFREIGELYPGFSAKYARRIPSRIAERAWVAAGFRFQLQRDRDRDVTEFHEYERFSQVYGVLSMEPGDGVFFHLLARRVILPDDPTIAGRTADFVGYAVPDSWNQFGAAAEWFVTDHTSVFGEVLEETRIRFRGNLDRTSLNAGVRYQDEQKGIGVWARRINHEGFSDHGLQMAWRF